jgi:hypothetical protein
MGDAGAPPEIVVWAARDPGTPAPPGTPLQHGEVVKGWFDPADGTSHEQVVTVAGDANNGAAVDPVTCVESGPGADELCGVFVDPAPTPGQHAFYYARAIENPSCRWAAYDCASMGDAGAPGCADGTVARVLQQRAWTSPIWSTGQ